MVTAQNIKPVELEPEYQPNIKGAFDPVADLEKMISEKLMTPLTTGVNPVVTLDKKQLQVSDITNLLVSALDEDMNADADDTLKELFEQTMVYYEKGPLPTNQLFLIQAGTKVKLPQPSSNVRYTPGVDVIPVAKEFLAGICDKDKFIATLGYFAKSETLGMYFMTETEFDDFKQYISNEVTNLGSLLPPETISMFSDFQNLKLSGLTESIRIRNNSADSCQEASFARCIVAMVMQYVKQNQQTGLIPFSINELMSPKTITFVNVEKHAHATTKMIAEEWNTINSSIQIKPKVLSLNKINKLTSAAKNINQMKKMANLALASKDSSAVRQKRYRFRKTRIESKNIIKVIKQKILRMADVNRSENVYINEKNSFSRANRRHPDDPDKMGKLKTTKYKPDLHLYIDTSGSIDESMYRATVMICISLAKALNINLYMNSFSSYVSSCSKLRTKDKNKAQIYNEFEKIPKVSGGTDYYNVWKYIMASPKRQRELSIMITDFEYTAPNHFFEHPKNLYYIGCDNTDWKWMMEEAERFCRSVQAYETDIRKHLIV